jgi:hypothetical protein
MRREEVKLPEELDERLREWARYFKDRRRYTRCQSIEGRFNPFAPGSWDAGWGDPGAPQGVLPAIVLPRVLRTHACVMGLPERSQRWAVTLRYCYPGLERFQILKIIRKYSGKRQSWKRHEEDLDIARMRVWACLLNG